MKREKKIIEQSKKQLDSANEFDEGRTTECLPSQAQKSSNSSMREKQYDEADYQNFQYDADEYETDQGDDRDLEFSVKSSLSAVFTAKNADIDRITADEFKNCDKAFLKVCEFYRQPLIALAKQLLGGAFYAEDAVQEVYHNLFEKRKDMTITSPKALLFRSVKNRCLDIFKHEKHERAHSEFVQSTSNAFVDSDDPLTLLDSKEKRRLLKQAIASLPEIYRRIVEWACFKGYSYKEIAEKLKIPVNSVGPMLIRARKMLSKILENMGFMK